MAQNLVIGQMKYEKSCCCKPSVALAITRRSWEVRSAVGLYSQASFQAEEVDDKRSDGMLSAEFGLHDLPAAQHLP
jgi:hypothetical protein